MASRKRVPRPALPKPGEVAARRGRTRTEVSDAAANEVRAKANATDPAASTSPQAVKSSRRRVDNPDKATYYLPPSVAEEIAIIAIRRKTSQSAIATEALEAYIAAQAAKRATG